MNKNQCSKCDYIGDEIDNHHPDKINKPDITIQLCKDCHYAEHHQEKEKFSGEILSMGYGILPNTILFDKELSSTAKLLYVLISSLCASSGYCYANNKYLAEKMNITPTQISVSISKLEKYLSFENRTGWQRKIYLKYLKVNHKEPLRKLNSVLKENLNHNIINNKDNINKEFSQKCLDKYNESFGTRFKSSVGWDKNASFWLTVYSEEEILEAIGNIKSDNFWKDKMDLTTLFRRRNPRGEDVDYIAKMLNQPNKVKQHRNFMIGGRAEGIEWDI